MEIKNFFSLQRRTSVVVSYNNQYNKVLKLCVCLIGVLLLSQCAFVEKKMEHREQIEATKGSSPSTEEFSQKEETEKVIVKDIVVKKKTPPKLGFVLSGGGIRTFAHVGVLKALQENRIPIHNIVGLGWGALVSALYAVNDSANSLEWQMLKLKEEHVFDQGFMSSKEKIQSISLMSDFLQKVFQKTRFANLRKSVSCPTQSVVTGAMYWVNEGEVANNIKSCIAFPPFYKPVTGRVAAPYALSEASQYLREEGAEAVVFIDVLSEGMVLSGKEESSFFREKLLWQRIQAAYKKAQQEVGRNKTDSMDLIDDVLVLDLENKSMRDFSSRRLLMQIGYEEGTELVEQLIKRYGY